MKLRFSVGDRVVVASSFDEELSPAARLHAGRRGEVEEIKPEYVPYPYSVRFPDGSQLAFSWDELVRVDELAPAEASPTVEGANVGGDPVNHPSHYNWLPGGLEVIDITRHFPFVLGNVLKYIFRAEHKGRELEDLRKARWYLDYRIRELEEAS
ncbi:DUF3310 domain-containing protein [Kitasatospora sp. NPDC059646]|uniref:DUF3310 domain-containing protein n=1 Tax=Kitasatospora sp. NPDC059646 TaxID=3346893 RepID=UPI0036C144FB